MPVICSNRTSLAGLALLALGLGVSGCSNIPQAADATQDPEVRALAAADGPKLGRLAVAPIATFGLAVDEAAKLWRPSESPAIDLEKVRADIVKTLVAAKGFDTVHPTSADAFGDAWRERDDFVATIEIQNLRTTYEGHRVGLWIVNIANWLFWIVPSWFVATEEYSLAFDATVTLHSAESGAHIDTRPILRQKQPVRVSGQFDELDRGWQFFGFIGPSFDKEVWLGIATKLFPAAQTELAAATARTIDEMLRSRHDSKQLADARRKTLALTLGVSRYQDPVQLPPLDFAAEDARAVRDAVARRGVVTEHLTTLVDSQATVANVKKAFADELSRAREGDTTLVYFAGYGSRGQDGSPLLLLSEATAAGVEGRITFADLAALLRAVKGQKLLVVDAGFGGRSRSVAVKGAAPSADDLSVFSADSSLTVLLSGGPSDPALAPEHLSGGLLTYHFANGLRGAADEDRDGRLSAQELFNHARPRVVAEAALLGERETPRASGLERPWVLEAPATGRSP